MSTAHRSTWEKPQWALLPAEKPSAAKKAKAAAYLQRHGATDLMAMILGDDQ